MSRLSAVAVTGNLTSPSRTVALARNIVSTLEGIRDLDTQLIDLSAVGSVVTSVVRRAEVAPEVEKLLLAVETADLLVAITPVYRGSFTGLFKHFFDLLEQDALRDVPVIIGATGGGVRHTLVVEYALRPLFAFFEAHTVPTAIYASDTDFDANRGLHPAVQHRVREAARQAVNLLSSPKPSPSVVNEKPLRLFP